MNDLCKQLISKEDYEIPNFNEVYLSFDKNTQTFHIYSKNKLPITTISNLLQNFNISILDSVSFINKNTYVYKIKTDIQHIDTFLKHEKIFLEILEKALLNKIYTLCKLYYMAWEGLTLREISLLRAIIKYQNQLFYEFNENLIISALLNNSKLTKMIIEYFKQKFSTKDLSLEEKIEKEIKNISNLNEDKIFRVLFTIVKNTVRTNYFLNKETISFKVLTQNFKNILFGMQPNIESYVYHNDFNGIHLRMSKISRGGLRWSDRPHDFRDEIKDLMITQEAKNALIIPEGAKGGFVIFKNNISKKDFKKYYSLFIDALLDLIDVGDVELVKYDENDFYFVVAADKGTSSMSDVANEIAIKRGYFLKDAFASGGSTGYSHKELGITAKGAIHTTNRFFIERGQNIYTDKLSVVGVGSMRGDVFGNGMLLNKNFLLLGAISHSEIFIDPNPDPKIAYEERKRLFENSLSWKDYDKSKISKGGGVFKRDEKSITLSPEIKELLNTKEESLSAEELAKRLLRLKVDLLYFGGIGTYVKSSEEQNLHISDKQNANIRVNANEINAFAICEGANLALTMQGRYEYALKGGKINLDAIDNSAGVNISDYEVNLKIILNSLIDKNKLTENEKIKILKEIQNDVIDKVLQNNFEHALLLSLDEKKIYKEKLIKVLEILEKNTDYFKRKNYNMPKNSEIETLYQNTHVIRPALAIVMLYSKIFLKKYILESNVLDSNYYDKFLKEYFPESFFNKFEHEIFSHPLKKEIIATQIANKIINAHGIGFISDYHEKSFKYKIESYLIMNELINADVLRKEIIQNVNDVNKQYDLLIDVEQTIKFAVKWMVKSLENSNIKPLLFITYKDDLRKLINQQNELEIYEKWKDFYKFLPAMFMIKHEYNLDLKTILNLFKLIITKFKINTILKTIKSIKPKNRLDKNLKEEVERLIEYFVITFAKEVINSSDFNAKNLKRSFDNYIKRKNDEYEDIIEEIKKIKKEKKSLTLLSHIANSLILQLLK
ncbi:NAD-glutamate dehydrogenase family protein [Nautilia profundicola AmH]|uniref:NAD-glutamate dehydrogenase family protein n=1 Tax=Nautilia profundicola (strain ATCC BAA-1463 / DSM 18972 / AmH) TaxID=598659 RepID=B9L9E1_NAUPA|nr:NAD-glutamate dehydrogenase domain-containing protein [Nautilia profundicola]ACM92763.1 NAD-glutamate dehydrogenase family protein [Nautilia profundicola AmH]